MPKVSLLRPATPTGMAFLDANADGRTDIALSCATGPVKMVLNEGSSRAFSQILELGFWIGCHGIASGDFDDDHVADLAVTWDQVGVTEVSIAMNTLANGHFLPHDVVNYGTGGQGPRLIVATDLEPNGYHDLLVGHRGGPLGSQDVSVLLNLGNPNIPQFIRGDADGDGRFNGLMDGSFLLAFQFIPGSPPPRCPDAADVDDDGIVNPLVDALFILGSQFVPGAPLPPAPFPWSGPDPTADNLGPCR